MKTAREKKRVDTLNFKLRAMTVTFAEEPTNRVKLDTGNNEYIILMNHLLLLRCVHIIL